MTKSNDQLYSAPRPLAPIADPGLVRPDWTDGTPRDPNMLWLDKNENTDPELAAVVRGVIKKIDPSTHFSYPEAGPLYRKLAKQLSVSPDCLLLAAGSDGVIRSVFESFVGQGDVVVHTSPTFAMYPVYSAMCGAQAQPVLYQASNSGPHLDLDELLATIENSSPRLVCLPNPDSPTGTMLGEPELRRVIEASGRVGALILIDEAYYPFSSYTAVSWIGEYPHLVTARSTGKAWGLAGLRIGFAVANPAVTNILHKVRPMYETSTFAINVFEAMLDHEDAVHGSVMRLTEGKTAFLDAMTALGFGILRGEGNFLHVAFGDHAPAVHTALADMVYYRTDFGDACLRGYSRFSSTTPALFGPVIERIRSCVPPSG